MAKVLVTGGAGFIGSHVVDYLVDKGHNVLVVDDLSGGLEKNVNSRANFIKGSITNPILMDKATKGVDTIYHLAAYAAEGLSPFIRRFNYTNNLLGSTTIVNSAIKNNVRMMVFTSSLAVYGAGNPPFDESLVPSPEDPYGVAKFAVEMDIKVAQKQHDLSYVILRPHNVYGERQFLGDPYRNVLGIWMNRIMQGKEPIVFGDGEQTRAFSYIGDIAPCIAESAFLPKAENQVINIGSAKPYSVNELADVVVSAMGTDLRPLHVEARHEVKHAHCTTYKSEELLGFKDKTSLEEGVKRMADWAKTTGPTQPIVWESYELTKYLPPSWQTLAKAFPNASLRMKPDEAIKAIIPERLTPENEAILQAF